MDSRILDSASFGCSCVWCNMCSRLGGSCPGVNDRVRVLEISAVWFMFPDRYPATDRSRVSNIPVPIRTTRRGFWAARGLLLPGNPLRLPTVWCSGIVKFKDKVKNGGAGKLPCLWVFEIIWCVLFLVCDSEHTPTNPENIKSLVSYSLYYNTTVIVYKLWYKFKMTI